MKLGCATPAFLSTAISKATVGPGRNTNILCCDTSSSVQGISEESPGRVVFTAPSGYSSSDTDDDESDGCTPSFSMQAPDNSSGKTLSLTAQH